MNSQYQEIGAAFVRYYYECHDGGDTKQNLVNLYHNDALMTYESERRQGKVPIMEKIMALPGQVGHAITKIDCQPLDAGGILIVVLGQLKTEGESNPLGFNHTFVIKPADGTFFIHHEIFQLTVHNF